MKHLLTIYYLPSWQGGDRSMALCCKPKIGWCEGPPKSDLTADPSEVDCPQCLAVRSGQRDVDCLERERPLRPPNHKKHLYLIWEASDGFMFPYFQERKAA